MKILKVNFSAKQYACLSAALFAICVADVHCIVLYCLSLVRKLWNSSECDELNAMRPSGHVERCMISTKQISD